VRNTTASRFLHLYLVLADSRCPKSRTVTIRFRLFCFGDRETQFQAAFDGLKPMREKHGLKDLGEFRAAEESDIVIVMLEVADVARAKEYWQSIVLAQGREKAGAVGLVPVATGVEAGSINQVWLTNGLVRDAIAGRSGANRR
jgi:hypothetical protein